MKQPRDEHMIKLDLNELEIEVSAVIFNIGKSDVGRSAALKGLRTSILEAIRFAELASTRARYTADRANSDHNCMPGGACFCGND